MARNPAVVTTDDPSGLVTIPFVVGFGDTGKVIAILPEYARVLETRFWKDTAFDAGTLIIGTAANDDAFAVSATIAPTTAGATVSTLSPVPDSTETPVIATVATAASGTIRGLLTYRVDMNPDTLA